MGTATGIGTTVLVTPNSRFVTCRLEGQTWEGHYVHFCNFTKPEIFNVWEGFIWPTTLASDTGSLWRRYWTI